MTWRQSWGENRVYYHDANGRLCSFPASFTNLAPLDPFVELAAGRSYFRVDDLLRLIQVIAGVREGMPGNRKANDVVLVNEIKPQC